MVQHGLSIVRQSEQDDTQIGSCVIWYQLHYVDEQIPHFGLHVCAYGRIG